MSQMRTPSKFPEHLPVEVLRDWALQAIAKNNAMLMGVTLKHAASSGYCLLDILGAAPALLAITDEASRKKNKSSSDSSVMLHEESGYGVPSSLPGRFMKVTKSIEETHGTKVPVHVPPAFASVAVAVAAATSQDMAAYCLRDGWALSAMMSMEPPASTAPPPIGFNRQESVYVTAIYDCVGEKEDELSFKVGDLIEVKRIGAVGGWCVGCLVDKPERPGLFPYSFAVSM
jgi:hypothetical protein